ncbi:sensor histidine kinase [Nibricoccus aquaticus]|nr:sensor histidine kinase [Nibricoccus aquaticus]
MISPVIGESFLSPTHPVASAPLTSRPATALPRARLLLLTAATGALLIAILTFMVLRFAGDLRGEIRQKLIERDATVLHPFAAQQLLESEAANSTLLPGSVAALTAVLKSARQPGMLAVAVFDEEGRTLQTVPSSMPFVELPWEDFSVLLSGDTISRYHPAFPLDEHFTGLAPGTRAPVLEVLLPLNGGGIGLLAGFARYYIDARPLTAELAIIDQRVNRQAAATLSIGSGLIILVLTGAHLGLRRAQRTIAERNERLMRTNFELTLSAKASALGQITSHLIHGLQGPVAGLRAVVADREGEAWKHAAAYTTQLQALIQEAVELLGEERSQAVYELTGREIADTIQRRNRAAALEKGVELAVSEKFSHALDNHRSSLLCLIAANLIQNAIAATPRGRRIDVSLIKGEGLLTLAVADQGPGIPPEIQTRLFEPGRSTRPGGTGLGLAISHLLARQLGGELALAHSSPNGATFQLRLPLA